MPCVQNLFEIASREIQKPFMRLLNKTNAKVIPTHPYEWIWEPLESEVGFLLANKFGGRSLYLDGKLVLFLIAKEEPWKGLLLCTDREQHPALIVDFPTLSPHPVLGKWLYLPESNPEFETRTARIVLLVKGRDPRIRVLPLVKKKKLKKFTP